MPPKNPSVAAPMLADDRLSEISVSQIRTGRKSRRLPDVRVLACLFFSGGQHCGRRGVAVLDRLKGSKMAENIANETWTKIEVAGQIYLDCRGQHFASLHCPTGFAGGDQLLRAQMMASAPRLIRALNRVSREIEKSIAILPTPEEKKLLRMITAEIESAIGTG